ncbi:MAG: hypothetical protein MUO61_00775 [Dehalococcoidia bacterium]|nr:hypothetical protein [Dehalococcoidia bacterium]
MFGSKGKINIAIQKSHYAPGDIVSGNVALTLKKPVKAKELSISLIGEQRITDKHSETSISLLDMGRSSSSSTRKIRIYDFKLSLDSEKEYTEGREYRFDIKIQGDIQPSPIKWYLLAILDISSALEISKKVDITIG